MVDTDQIEQHSTGIGVAVAVVLVFVLFISLYGVASVDEGERGVEKTQGAVTGEVYDPGWHVLVPLYQSVEYIEVRPQSYTMSGDVFDGDVDEEDAITFRSADQQEIGADITVRYQVDEDRVDAFHTDWNTISQFEQRLLRPETIDTVAREGSGFNATIANSEEGREEIGDVVAASLSEEAPDYVTISSVQVRDIHLDPEFQSALEDVEIAQQEAEAERTRAQGDADAERIRAEGDADAFEIRNRQLTEEVLALEQIQAYDAGTVFVIDDDQQVLLDPDQSPGTGETQRAENTTVVGD